MPLGFCGSFAIERDSAKHLVHIWKKNTKKKEEKTPSKEVSSMGDHYYCSSPLYVSQMHVQVAVNGVDVKVFKLGSH